MECETESDYENETDSNHRQKNTYEWIRAEYDFQIDKTSWTELWKEMHISDINSTNVNKFTYIDRFIDTLNKMTGCSLIMHSNQIYNNDLIIRFNCKNCRGYILKTSEWEENTSVLFGVYYQNCPFNHKIKMDSTKSDCENDFKDSAILAADSTFEGTINTETQTESPKTQRLTSQTTDTDLENPEKDFKGFRDSEILAVDKNTLDDIFVEKTDLDIALEHPFLFASEFDLEDEYNLKENNNITKQEKDSIFIESSDSSDTNTSKRKKPRIKWMKADCLFHWI